MVNATYVKVLADTLLDYSADLAPCHARLDEDVDIPQRGAVKEGKSFVLRVRMFLLSLKRIGSFPMNSESV